MIEINLLPEELKTQIKQKAFAEPPSLKRFLFVLPAAAALLVCLHIYLAGANIAKNALLRRLTREWEALAPQRKEIDDFNKNYAAFNEDIKAIQRLTAGRVNWAQKLERLSRDLPAGIWFRGLFIKSADFTLEGSVISLEEDEMGLIKAFIEALKNDAEFFQGFDSLELASVQRKAVGSYKIIDFVLSGKLKTQ